MCFVLTLRDCKLCWCVLQEKPVRPPCGITTPGCISMTTPQRGSLPSLSRTLSTPCSLMPASLSCSGTQWKGRSSLVYVHICTKMVATTQIQFWHAHRHLGVSIILFTLQIQTDTFLIYRKQKMCCLLLWLSNKCHYDSFTWGVKSLLLKACESFCLNWGYFMLQKLILTSENVWTCVIAFAPLLKHTTEMYYWYYSIYIHSLIKLFFSNVQQCVRKCHKLFF